MPKINRIRIANVSYGSKYILDQTINSFDGENVLINLSNGGGKSVLTQMFLQPILPLQKVHKRNVDSYLSAQGPTFAMIEWKLDNKKSDTYCLTGIVLHKNTNDENNEKIKYFTFVNEYENANSFDISHIDFIVNEEGFTKYKSYEYCLKSLKEQERYNSKIRLFNSDERKDYYQILEEYGIFKDEWKILAKINEKEGGIDDMFENCQTSDDVINHWVLKNISANLANSEKLNEMFTSLMEDIIQKEDIIARKEVLDNFSGVASSYIEDVKKLLNSISEENEILGKLEKIYLKLQAYLKQKEQEKQDRENEDWQINEALEHIEYEELSEEIHKLQFDLKQKRKELDAKSAEQSEGEAKVNQIKNAIDMQKAAKINARLNLEKEKLCIEQKKKKDLENKTENDEKYNLEFSLKGKYEEELLKIVEEVEKLEADIKDIEDVIKNNNKRKNDIQNVIYENQKNIGVLDKGIEDFENDEIDIKQKLKLNFSRNILGKLDSKEINEILENYEKAEAEYLKKAEDLKNNIEQENEKQTKYKENKINLENEIESEGKLLENVKRDYEEYKKRELELIEALKSVSIDKERLFDKEENLIEMKRLLANVEKRSIENILKLSRVREEKTKLENGEYHIDFEFGKVLDKNKINYQTGEKYLSEQSREYVERLLQNNPMLPYSYIIYEKDYEKIKAIKTQFVSDKVIPIILSKNMEGLGDFENGIFNGDNICLACFYNKEVFKPDSKLKLISSLSIEIENLEEANKYDKNEINKIQNVISQVENFDYSKDSKRMLEDKINNIKETVENKKQEKEENDKKIAESLKEVETLKNQILENTKKIENNKADKEKFEEFRLKDEKYQSDLEQRSKLEKENIALNDEKEKLELEDEGLTREKENKKIERSNKKNKEGDIRNKYVSVATAKEATILEFSLETLEKMYEESKRNFSASENEILKNIDEAFRNIDDYEKELKKYSHIIGYEKEEYSEEKLDLYEKEYEEKNKSFEECKRVLQQIANSKVEIEIRLDDRKNRDLKKLNKEEPLELKEIKGRYEERKRDLKQRSLENKKIIKDICQAEKDINEEIKKVVKSIDEEECKRKYIGEKLDLSTFDIQQINIGDLTEELNQKKTENCQMIEKLKRNYNDIYNSNNGKDQAIDNILKNMNSNSEKNSYEGYYFVFERTVNSLERLSDMIQTINSDIMHIEDDKINFKRQAFMQGKNIYLEMKSISDSTSIKIQGKSRKVPLMEIILPKELDQFAEERIDEYIEKCILDLREESRIIENPKIMIEKKIKTLLSDRELLNKVINAESIDLKLYKIDINEENSGLKKWKDVIVENSGGEKVISCLILVLALMQYSRKKVLERYGENENKEMSKIFIIDNPFGKMSSPHLLNGLTMILNKFNVQAICLSDLSQSSITNQFNLIYQMSLKTALYANNAYLTVDKIVNDNNLKNNSVLDHIFMKTENQVKLWEL